MHAHTHNTLTFLRCWLPVKFSWCLDPYNAFTVFYGSVKWKKNLVVRTRYAQGVSHVTVIVVLAGWDSQSASYLTNHVKWTDSEELNHPEPKRRFLFPLELSGSRRFGWVEPPRTHVKRTGSEKLNTPNSRAITLWSLFPRELSGSRRFGRVEPPWRVRGGSTLHNLFEPPRTREKLPNHPCSLWSSVVQGDLVGLNHPELTSNP